MKRNFTKHIIAAVSAAMLTMSLSAGVMAAEAPNPNTQPPAGIEQPAPAPQDNGEAPDQGMQQMPPKEAPQEGQKPAGEQPAGEKPADEKPAEGTTQDAQQLPPAQMDQKPAEEMKDNGVENTLKAVEALDDSDQKTNLQSLLEAYKAAVEAADKTTDEASRKTALEAVDAAREALNAALTEAGVDSQISAVEEIAEGQKPAEEMKDNGVENTQKPAEVKPAEKIVQDGTTAVAPAAESTETAQNAADKENMNLFQKFLQWLKGFGKKN